MILYGGVHNIVHREFLGSPTRPMISRSIDFGNRYPGPSAILLPLSSGPGGKHNFFARTERGSQNWARLKGIGVRPQRVGLL
jgi:hypothetical protein